VASIIALFFLLLTLSAAPADELFFNFESDSKTSACLDDQSPSQDVCRPAGIPNRFGKGKFLLKSFTPFHDPAERQTPLSDLRNETSLFCPFSRHCVYQQISVYRI
jgi:hypothetical protein